MNKITNNWLRQAKDDLEKAQILFNNKKFDGTAFYSEQTAEKALKAVYLQKYYNGANKTYNST